MKNLELKVKVPSLEIIKQSLSFATFSGNLHQKDTYYLLGERRLKIREQKGKGEMIYYVRKNKKNTKESKYFRFPLSPISLLLVEDVLSFIFGQKTTVEKERQLYLYKNTRIHLDNVKNLGTFLELETVVHDSSPEKAFVEEQEEIKIKLKFDPSQYVSGSYSDLVV